MQNADEFVDTFQSIENDFYMEYAKLEKKDSNGEVLLNQIPMEVDELQNLVEKLVIGNLASIELMKIMKEEITSRSIVAAIYLFSMSYSGKEVALFCIRALHKIDNEVCKDITEEMKQALITMLQIIMSEGQTIEREFNELLLTRVNH